MNILLGLTGSVASTLITKLVAALENDVGSGGNIVRVVLTENALPFVEGSDNRACLHRLAYAGELFFNDDGWNWKDAPAGESSVVYFKGAQVLHIELAQWADVLVIAPLTANTLAKLANGICDNLLTDTARAFDYRQKAMLVAPAMNTVMWNHPLTDKQLRLLRSWGVYVVSPQSKLLACGDYGMGAMADVAEIADAVTGWSAKRDAEKRRGAAFAASPEGA